VLRIIRVRIVSIARVTNRWVSIVGVSLASIVRASLVSIVRVSLVKYRV